MKTQVWSGRCAVAPAWGALALATVSIFVVAGRAEAEAPPPAAPAGDSAASGLAASEPAPRGAPVSCAEKKALPEEVSVAKGTPGIIALPSSGPGHLLVTLGPDVPEATLRAHTSKFGVKIRKKMRAANSYLVDLTGVADRTAKAFIQAAKETRGVSAAEPYGIVYPPGRPKGSEFIAHVYYEKLAELEKLDPSRFTEYHNVAERYADVLMDPGEFWRLSADGFRVQVSAEATRGLGVLPAPSPSPAGRLASREVEALAAVPSTFYGGYRTINQLYADLQSLAAAYPAITEWVDYGDSYSKKVGGVTTLGGEFLAGYDLRAMRVTNKSIPGPKPVFFFMANIHAREITTPEVAMRMLDWLVQGYGTDADATWLVDWHDLWIIPVANPDGHWYVELGTLPPYSGSPFLWRKNGNKSTGCLTWPPTGTAHYGVDLNRNFAFKFGGPGSSGSSCAVKYRGPSAASEPETAALQTLVRALIPDQRGPLDTDVAPDNTTGILLTFHSYGKTVLWPWGFTTTPAPNSAGLAAIGNRLALFNGYTPVHTSTTPLASGITEDWSYGELGIPSYTFELGTGFFRPYSEVDSIQWPDNKGALIYAAKIARTPYMTVRGPETKNLAGAPSGSLLALSAVIDDTTNGGQNVAAAEYYIDQPPWAAGAAAHALAAGDGLFNSPTETAVATFSTGALSPGRHILFVRGQDAAGNWGALSAIFFTGGQLPRSDFNGDRKADILFRHPSSGGVYLWLMQ